MPNLQNPPLIFLLGLLGCHVIPFQRFITQVLRGFNGNLRK